jgi:hypothetical protein
MPKIIGFDGIPAVFAPILDGRIVGTIDVHVDTQGIRAWEAASSRQFQETPVSIKPSYLSQAGILRRRSHTHCFISYSRSDETLAGHLRNRLHAAGFVTFMDTHDVPAGSRFVVDIRNQVLGSHFFLLIALEAALSSAYVRDELRVALKQIEADRLHIIPILTNLEEPPDELRAFSFFYACLPTVE